jgi:hypothetical protein
MTMLAAALICDVVLVTIPLHLSRHILRDRALYGRLVAVFIMSGSSMFSTLAAGVFWLKQALEEAVIASLVEVRSLSTECRQDRPKPPYLGLGLPPNVQHRHVIDASCAIGSFATAAHKGWSKLSQQRQGFVYKHAIDLADTGKQRPRNGTTQ